MDRTELRGSLRLLFLYDIGEGIDVALARQTLGGGETRKIAQLPHTPRYLGFEEPPSLLGVDRYPIRETLLADVEYKAFSYGIFTLSFRVHFAGDWTELLQFSADLLEDPALAPLAKRKAQEIVARINPAIRQPDRDWRAEDYLVIELESAETRPHGALNAEQLIARHGQEIARLVRGETLPLSASEAQEVLSGTLSCYQSDVMVIGWAAAFVYDSTDGREATVQLIEYANSQLLEFRHYDARLTRILSELYSLLQAKQAWWRRWRIVRETERLNRLRLDVAELAERGDNSLRLLGDMFYARAFRVISSRIGLTDFRHFVEEKLTTARELYDFFMDHFNHQRTFVLETTVVLILVIELVRSFWIKH